MHYAQESDTGHLTLMHARLKRLHDSMRARGASEAAIARLPKLPTLVKPIDHGLAPVVLATPRNGTDYATQERLRKIREPGYVKPVYKHKAKAAVKQYASVGYDLNWYRGDTCPEQFRRAIQIIDIVAVAAGIDPWRVRSKSKPADVVPVRQIGIKLALELTRISAARLSAAFESEHSTIRHNHRRARLLLDSGDALATDLHARALAACRARWPEYQIEQQREAA